MVSGRARIWTWICWIQILHLPHQASWLPWILQESAILAQHSITIEKDLKAETHNEIKSASMVATFSRIIIYIHTLHAKDDLTRRKFSGDSNWKGCKCQERKQRQAGELSSNSNQRAEYNKRRLNWRERAAAAFEEKYSKHRANLKKNQESWEETHGHGQLVGFRLVMQCCSREGKKELIFRSSASEVEKSHSW